MSRYTSPVEQLPQRQGALLSLLGALGGTVSNLDFQKLLLLYCKEHPEAAAYEFVPYRFGGFSFTSYADRRKLIERGLIAADESSWSLTETGTNLAQAQGSSSSEVRSFAKGVVRLRGDALVAETYRRFPYLAIRSEIANRVLKGDRPALAAVDSARPVTVPGLCTLGYQGLSLEAYLNRLVQAGVTVLCDVRRNPLSRKYGFSKKTLQHAGEGLGLRYEHVPELGIASDERRDLTSAADYERLFARYERETLRRETGALGRIAQWVRDGDLVALTCFEKQPSECHRLRVAFALKDALRGFPDTVHL